MAKNILVFNVGSYSIKYSIFKNTKKISQGKYDRLKSREDYRRAFVDAAPLKGKIFDLLTFCPEIKVIKAVLRNGGFIAEEGLLWLYNAYKNGNIAKREIVEILSDESLPFWPKDLVNKIQKNGIIGFEEWLREHNII